jgi:hypothetical protein
MQEKQHCIMAKQTLGKPSNPVPMPYPLVCPMEMNSICTWEGCDNE